MTIEHKFYDKSFVLDYSKLDKNHFFPKQVHKADVKVITSKEDVGEPYTCEVDASVTNQKGIVLCISTADCAPIVIEDNKNGVIAAVHAGWKSACRGIIGNAVKEMKKLGSDPRDMQVYIGPCLGQASFECEYDLLESFTYVHPDNIDFFERVNQEKWLFDLKGFCVKEFNEAGVYDIEVSDIDTYTSDDYHSYRGFEAKNPNIGYEKGKYRNLTTVEIL